MQGHLSIKLKSRGCFIWYTDISRDYYTDNFLNPCLWQENTLLNALSLLSKGSHRRSRNGLCRWSFTLNSWGYLKKITLMYGKNNGTKVYCHTPWICFLDKGFVTFIPPGIKKLLQNPFPCFAGFRLYKKTAKDWRPYCLYEKERLSIWIFYLGKKCLWTAYKK